MQQLRKEDNGVDTNENNERKGKETKRDRSPEADEPLLPTVLQQKSCKV